MATEKAAQIARVASQAAKEDQLTEISRATRIVEQQEAKAAKLVQPALTPQQAAEKAAADKALIDRVTADNAKKAQELKQTQQKIREQQDATNKAAVEQFAKEAHAAEEARKARAAELERAQKAEAAQLAEQSRAQQLSSEQQQQQSLAINTAQNYITILTNIKTPVDDEIFNLTNAYNNIINPQSATKGGVRRIPDKEISTNIYDSANNLQNDIIIKIDEAVVAESKLKKLQLENTQLYINLQRAILDAGTLSLDLKQKLDTLDSVINS